MEKQVGTVLFVPFVQGAKFVEGVDPGAAAFNIDVIWRQISAVSIPPRDRFLPKIESAGPAPRTPIFERAFAKVSPLKLLAAAGALAVLIKAPALWFVWAGLAAYAVFGTGKSTSDKLNPLLKNLTEAESRWFNAVLAWQKRAGVDELLQLHQQLQIARDEYIDLEGAKRRENDRYKSQRREKQLHAFLENYQILNARIRGIGTAKQAALASYGIDTAADISTAKVIAVPGIGPAIAEDLVKWRKSCESRFRYLDAPNQADAQELANISLKYASRAVELRRTLVAGPANLHSLSQRIVTASAVGDPLVSKATGEQEALRQRIKDLGGTLSPTSFEWPTPRSSQTLSAWHPSTTFGPRSSARTQPTIPTSPAPPTSSTSSRRTQSPIGSTITAPACPRCSGKMITRLARRGRNAGGSFWGCSRYPVCRGTRSI